MFYDAATDVSRWRMALQSLADHFDAFGAGIFSAHIYERMIVSPSMDPAMDAYFGGGWDALDLQTIRAGRLARHFDCASEYAVMSPEEVATDPHYQEFRRPHGLGGVIATADTRGGLEHSYIIAIQRRVGQDFPEGDEAKLARRMLAHAERARAVAALLLPSADWTDPIADALEACTVAAAVVTPAGRVLHANARFCALDTLTVSRNAVACYRPEDTRRLAALVSGTAARDLSGDAPSFALAHRRDGRRPVLLRAIPLTRGRAANDHVLFHDFAPRVLLVAIDLEATRKSDVSEALRQLGLTRAETRLAIEFAAGGAPREIAERFEIAETTVRSQMRAIYRKLDLTRQTDLVRLVAQLSQLA